jgi:G3E family GTPase
MKLYLIGGFLGSGKTTAIQQACSYLMATGRNVAVVTNDQGNELVDTGYLKSFGISTAQVVDGCFCCNYNALSEAINNFVAKDHPDIIFAESVGSCTDLVATIAKPLEKLMPGIEVVVSVFADALQLYSLLHGHSSFLNDELRYIYKKQLEETDILVINKIDLLNEGELLSIRGLVEADYTSKTILYQHSFNPNDVQKWLKTMDDFSLKHRRDSLRIDYDTYARGEAMLAWLDERITIKSTVDNAYEAAIKMIYKIEDAIRSSRHAVGHLKFLIEHGVNTRKISFTALPTLPVRQMDYPPAASVAILINARIEANPLALNDIITSVMQDVIAETGCTFTIDKLSSFQPGYPRPTHRIAH